MTDQLGLRERILKGGSFLAARQVASMAISFAGLALLAGMIGPANYGYYTGAAALIAFIDRLAPLGINAYLIRRKDDPEPSVYHQAFTVLLLIVVVVVSLGYAASFLLTAWLNDPNFTLALWALLPTLIISVTAVPAKAQIERDMNYRALAIWQLMEHIGFYAVALPMAFAGSGLWAPVAGAWAMKLLLMIRSYTLTGYSPRLHWSRSEMREILGYSLSYSASSHVWRLRDLANPLIVGRFLGPEAVAFVNLAIRFATMLAFVKGLSWGLSMVALGKVQDDLGRLRKGIEEGMFLQAIALGPVLGGFALVAPWVLPVVFGADWGGVLRVYPFIALGMLINAVFNMHSSALYVLRKNRSVGLANAINVALFLASAFILVPRFGLIGYGLAEIVAIPGYLVFHRRLQEFIPISYDRVWPWTLASIPPLFVVFVPLQIALLLWIPMLIVLLWRWRHVYQYVSYVRWRTA